MFAAFIIHNFEGSRFCGVWDTLEGAQKYLETFFENDTESDFQMADCYYVVDEIEMNNPKWKGGWSFHDQKTGWKESS